MAPAPIATPPKPEPASRPVVTPRPIPELPPVSLTLPPESGLELVETRFKPAPIPEEVAPRPAGSRRVRPPKAESTDEPLQMVETHKEQQPPAS